MITSVDNGRVKDVLRLRKARERRLAGLFVAEGVREVRRALEAGLVARALYVAPEVLPDWRATTEANRDSASRHAASLPATGRSSAPRDTGAQSAAETAGTRGSAPRDAAAQSTTETAEARRSAPPAPQEVSARVLARMSYRAEPEGVLGVFEVPQREFPAGARLALVAVDIEKPGNLGAMARTADAAGADALLVAGTASDPWNPNAIRASTGAVFTLPIIDVTLDEVCALPLQRVAAVVGAPIPYTAADLTVPTALIVGSEDEGLDLRWREAADVHVSIPMEAQTADSLNAATSAALLLYEAVRQRG